MRAESSDLSLAVDLLDVLIDPDECWFDHSGGCQAHGFLSLVPGEVCPNEEARQLVERLQLPNPPVADGAGNKAITVGGQR